MTNYTNLANKYLTKLGYPTIMTIDDTQIMDLVIGIIRTKAVLRDATMKQIYMTIISNINNDLQSFPDDTTKDTVESWILNSMGDL